MLQAAQIERVLSTRYGVEVQFGDSLTVHLNRTLEGKVFLNFSFTGEKTINPIKQAANQVMVEFIGEESCLTTQKGTKMPQVTREQLDEFIASCQKLIDENYKQHYPNLVVPTLTADIGKRYARIVRSDEAQRSAHCFVDMTNGNVLKTASWKTPAKHARGNLFNQDKGMGCMSPYGAAYLR